jgi:hypothetical protein
MEWFDFNDKSNNKNNLYDNDYDIIDSNDLLYNNYNAVNNYNNDNDINNYKNDGTNINNQRVCNTTDNSNENICATYDGTMCISHMNVTLVTKTRLKYGLAQLYSKDNVQCKSYLCLS